MGHFWRFVDAHDGAQEKAIEDILRTQQEVVARAAEFVAEPATPRSTRRELTRDDLYLVCFEEVVRAPGGVMKPSRARTSNGA